MSDEPITDLEAMAWPLEESVLWCPHGCGKSTHFTCGLCGEPLCDRLSCIKAHAAADHPKV